MDEAIKEKIENQVKNNKVFLYMKGTPDAPQCGFSGQAIGILKELNADFNSFNIFDDENIRQGIKEFSDWPTIPQLYINGEFVGGCDIMTEMYQNGDLAKALT